MSRASFQSAACRPASVSSIMKAMCSGIFKEFFAHLFLSSFAAPEKQSLSVGKCSLYLLKTRRRTDVRCADVFLFQSMPFLTDLVYAASGNGLFLFIRRKVSLSSSSRSCLRSSRCIYPSDSECLFSAIFKSSSVISLFFFCALNASIASRLMERMATFEPSAVLSIVLTSSFLPFPLSAAGKQV